MRKKVNTLKIFYVYSDIYHFQCFSFFAGDFYLFGKFLSYIISFHPGELLIYSTYWSSGLLVTIYFSFALCENFIIYSLFCNVWLLGNEFWFDNFYSLITLEMLLCLLLASIVSAEKQTSNQITLPIYLMCHFSLAALKVCFLSWDFYSLTIMNLGEGSFTVILLGFHWSRVFTLFHQIN